MRLDHLLLRKGTKNRYAIFCEFACANVAVHCVQYKKTKLCFVCVGCFLPRPVRDRESLKPQGCGRKGKGSLKSHREGTETAVLEEVRPEKEEAAAASTGAGSLNKKPARCELCSAMGRMRWRS